MSTNKPTFMERVENVRRRKLELDLSSPTAQEIPHCEWTKWGDFPNWLDWGKAWGDWHDGA